MKLYRHVLSSRVRHILDKTDIFDIPKPNRNSGTRTLRNYLYTYINYIMVVLYRRQVLDRYSYRIQVTIIINESKP